MLNALIVVYRESFEAMLIVGLLYSFLVRRNASHSAFKSIFLGAAAGLSLSGMLAYGIYTIESEIGGFSLEMFQLAMMIIAVILITHMCLWMKLHAAHLKSDLETNANQALNTGHLISLATLTAISVGREGSETVIFLYGLMIESFHNGLIYNFIFMSLAGLCLGILTWLAFQKGFSFFKQKTFFNISSILLFITAGSMMMSISAKLIELDWISLGRNPIWDSTWLLSEDSFFGSLIKIITGYRAQPAQFTVIMYCTYWLIVLFLFNWTTRQPTYSRK